MTEKIIIEGQTVQLSNGDDQSHAVALSTWMGWVSQHCLRGLTLEPIADQVKWQVSCGPAEIVVIELAPALRTLQWIAPDSPAPYGPNASSRPRRLATPYVILKVPFRRGRVLGRVEVFYRNEPLSQCNGPGGELFWPNLLNISPNAHGCTAWMCTQFLDRERRPPGITGGLNAVVHHLWGGPFNFSSEAHEGTSAFGKACADGIDPRVTDIDRWEAESIRDPRFILSVPWRSTGLDVQKLILGELAFQKLEVVPGTASSLANHLLLCQRRKAGSENDED
jgi:hypothetical protein